LPRTDSSQFSAKSIGGREGLASQETRIHLATTLIAASVKKPLYGGGGMNPRFGCADDDQAQDSLFWLQRRISRWTKERPCAAGRQTSANVHDSRLAEALIQGDEQGYFADKAYSS
jgi:hypothetical protein